MFSTVFSSERDLTDFVFRNCFILSRFRVTYFVFVYFLMNSYCGSFHHIYEHVLHLYLFSKHTDNECYHYLTVLPCSAQCKVV